MATAVWLVRAGRRGEREDIALDQNITTIGWAELGDLTGLNDRQQLQERMISAHPNASKFTITNWVSQVWPFLAVVKPGDIVAMPLKRRPGIALGRISGPYQFRSDLVEFDAAHTRKVTWERRDAPRAAFGQDLLYSLGAFMTVCRIERNNAIRRIESILNGGSDDGHTQATDVSDAEAAPELVTPIQDIEEQALDGIMDHLIRKYKGYDLERIVEAVLTTQGYVVQRTEKGADGGVDLTAGRGDFGFESPRLCVQVKSSDGQIDAKPVRELQGALKNFGADHGLFVSWGGFSPSVYKEARRSFFEIRLWSGRDLVNEILAVYEKLPEDIRSSIPLKQMWVLVPTAELAKG